MAEAPGAGAQDLGQLQAVVDAAWDEYDTDKSGYLDKTEMMPLADQALKQIGYEGELDEGALVGFF